MNDDHTYERTGREAIYLLAVSRTCEKEWVGIEEGWNLTLLDRRDEIEMHNVRKRNLQSFDCKASLSVSQPNPRMSSAHFYAILKLRQGTLCR